LKKDSLFRRYDALLNLAAGLVSGGLFRIGTGLQPLWYLAWLAPVPLLILARTRTKKITYFAGALAVLVWESSNLAYLTGILGQPRAIAILAAKTLLWPIGLIVVRKKLWLYPFLCVTVETFAELFSSHGTFHSLAYSQMDFLPAIQIASLLGPAGVTFIVTLFGAGVALLAIHRRPFDLLLLLPPAFAIAWGAWRVPLEIESPTIKVGLIGTVSRDPDRLLPLIDNLASRAAKIIVLPEKFLDAKAETLQPFLLAARQLRLYLLLGINNEAKWNQAVLLGPDGEMARYNKVHLVPGWEKTFQAGDRPVIQQLPQALVGLAICKDMDFPQWSRRYGQSGVEILLVPAADFPGDAWLHSRISILRGVENGFSVARTALDGNLTLSDRYGRILAESRTEPTLAAEVPVVSARTLYSEIGASFGIACALILLASFHTYLPMLTRKA